MFIYVSNLFYILKYKEKLFNHNIWKHFTFEKFDRIYFSEFILLLDFHIKSLAYGFAFNILESKYCESETKCYDFMREAGKLRLLDQILPSAVFVYIYWNIAIPIHCKLFMTIFMLYSRAQ